MRLLKPSIRTSVLILVVVSMLPFYALLVYVIGLQREIERENLEQKAILLSKNLGITQEKLHATILESIESIVLAIRSFGADADTQEAFLAAYKGKNELFANIILTDVQGTLLRDVYSTKERVNYADRPYFQEALLSDRPVTAEYTISRTTGKPVLPYAYALRGADGRPSYVLIASLDLSVFEERLEGLIDESSGYVELVDRNGRLLYRSGDAYWIAGEEAAAPLGSESEDGLETLDSGALAANYIVKDSRGPAYRARAVLFMPPDGLSGFSSRGIVIAMFLLVAMSLIAYYVGERLIAKRIRTLSALAEEIGVGGGGGAPPNLGGADEISALTDRFKAMAIAVRERELAQEEARSALAASLAEKERLLDEKEILLKEIQHRVKNSYQLILSLLSLQADGLEGAPAQALKVAAGRLRSLATLHEHMRKGASAGKVVLKSYLEAVLSQLERESGARDRVRVEARIPPLELKPDRAGPLGLIVNELVGNAYRHAFAGGKEGTLLVTLEQVGVDSARLTVRDDGPGLPPSVDPLDPSRCGLGFTIAVMLAAQLGGSFERLRLDKGFGASVRFPL
jgi:two-component sensor histidine kinase